MNSIIPMFSRESEPLQDRIRERAYFLWLDRGSPHGEDWEHWFAAKQDLLASLAPAAAEHPARPDDPDDAPPHFSIEKTLSAHLNDPTHRFHAPGAAHDARLDVVAGEARQRVRGRHFDSSLRAQPKKQK